MYYILFMCFFGHQTCFTAQYPDYSQCAYGAKTFEAVMFKDRWHKPTVNWYCQSVRVKK